MRVNVLGSEWGISNPEVVVCGGASTVRLPEIGTVQNVVDTKSEVLRIENACSRESGNAGLLVAIESSLGITHVVEIAYVSKRLIDTALGAEDYVCDLCTECSPEGTELLFTRCSTLQAVRSAGTQAFNTMYSDANSETGFLHEATCIK